MCCVAHTLNLIVQNGLGLWKKNVRTESEACGEENGEEVDLNLIEEDCLSEYDEEADDSGSCDSDEEVVQGRVTASDFESDESDKEIEPNNNNSRSPELTLEEVSRVVCSMRKAAKQIKNLSVLLQLFEKEAKKDELDPDKLGWLIQDMKVRWNSTFHMVSRFLEYETQIRSMATKVRTLNGLTPAQLKTFNGNVLSDRQWDILKCLKVC